MTGPPRLADSLLRHVLPVGDAGDTIRGDVLEEWRHRGGSAAATRWYWRQAISLAVRYAWRGRRGVRPGWDPGVRTRRRYMLALDNLGPAVRYAVRS